MHVSDFLSRAPLQSTNDFTAFDETLASLNEQTQTRLELIASPELRKLLQTAASNDLTYQELIKYIQTGWPAQLHKLPASLKPYYNYADELNVSNGFVYKGDRVVIPAPARDEVMSRLHKSHIGLGGLLRRARSTVYFPGITSAITRVANECQVCQNYKQENQKETLLSHETPPRVWDKCGVDIFTFNRRDYLVTVCYLSNYFEVDRLNTKSCTEIIRILKGHFSRWGTPSTLCSDNSPFNSTEFAKFAKDWGFQQVFSSPRYPQSNGKVEKSVQTIKTLMQKALDDNQDCYKALLEFRNTPTESSNLSPMQIMINRQTRSVLPVANTKLSSMHQQTAQEALSQAKQKQAFYYDRTARDHPPLNTGDNVRIKDNPADKHWRTGTVIDCLPYRSYNVKLDDNTVRRRTSRHVRWSPTPPVVLGSSDDDENNEPTVRPTSAAAAAATNANSVARTSSQSVNTNMNNEQSSRHVHDGQSNRDQLKSNGTLTTRSGRVIKRPQRYMD
jgi:hypothetical protein